MASYAALFRLNPNINPYTGRKILFEGPTYWKLMEEFGIPRTSTMAPVRSSLKRSIPSSPPRSPAVQSPGPRKIASPRRSKPPSSASTSVLKPAGPSEKSQLIMNRVPGAHYAAPVLNPNRSDHACSLISTRKESKYISTYNPGPLLDKLRDMGFTEAQLNIFDSQITPRCANVISIALYLRPKSQHNLSEILHKYLYTIRRTIQNVAANLPDWIVRIYLDGSVYDFFDDAFVQALPTGSPIYPDDPLFSPKTVVRARDVIQFILSADNVEVYTYDCPDTEENIARMRTYRFLPLSDPQVNLCAVREADGIVTKLDCQNLRLFEAETPGRLFYLPPVEDSYKVYHPSYGHNPIVECGPYPFQSYSLWLNLYQEHFMEDYFKQNVILYDLLAGTFACKLRIKRDVYRRASETINTQIQQYTTIHIPAKIQEVKATQPNKYIQLDEVERLKRLRLAMATGYDEILLLVLYLDFATRPYGHRIQFYDDYVNQLFYAKNVPILNLTASSDFKDWMRLMTEFGIKINRAVAAYRYTCFRLKKQPPRLSFENVTIPRSDNSHLAYFIDSVFSEGSTDQIMNVSFTGEHLERSGFNMILRRFNMILRRSTFYLSEYLNVPYNPIYDDCYI